MPTPPHVPELVSALGDVLREVCAPAVRDDDFAYAQVLTASSIVNYLTAELAQGGGADEPGLRSAQHAVEDAASTVRGSRPDVAAAIREAGSLRGAYRVAESLAGALDAVRGTEGEPACHEARW